MKVSEMNARQRKAYYNILFASDWLIGGLENTMDDNSEDSEDYINAKKQLEDHDGLVEQLYQMATTDYYQEDGCMFGANIQSFLKDIRFCGKDWLMERCERRITKAGY